MNGCECGAGPGPVVALSLLGLLTGLYLGGLLPERERLIAMAAAVAGFVLLVLWGPR